MRTQLVAAVRSLSPHKCLALISKSDELGLQYTQAKENHYCLEQLITFITFPVPVLVEESIQEIVPYTGSGNVNYPEYRCHICRKFDLSFMNTPAVPQGMRFSCSDISNGFSQLVDAPRHDNILDIFATTGPL